MQETLEIPPPVLNRVEHDARIVGCLCEHESALKYRLDVLDETVRAGFPGDVGRLADRAALRSASRV